MVKLYHVRWDAVRRTNKAFTRCGSEFVISDNEYNAMDEFCAVLNKRFSDKYDWEISNIEEVSAIIAINN